MVPISPEPKAALVPACVAGAAGAVGDVQAASTATARTASTVRIFMAASLDSEGGGKSLAGREYQNSLHFAVPGDGD
jgi:hypothetical protein